MKLEMKLIKEFSNEANMRASRDSVRQKAEAAGFLVYCSVDGS